MWKNLPTMFFLLIGTLSYSQDMSIPEGRPRIWWNEATLETAIARFGQDPFEPRAKGDFDRIEAGGWKWNNEVPLQNALYYLFTGDREAAQTAIAWARYNLTETLEMEMNEERITCNRCRWWLQEIIIVYDWCHAELSSEDKAFFLEEISNVVDRWNNEERWGTPDEPASNYNQGYMRNSFLWGVAAMGELEQAQAYIDHALDERWAKIVHYFEEENKSGIPAEGTSYGHTLLNYMLVMFETAQNAGLTLFDQSFFRKAVMFAIYHTTPGPTEYPSGRGNFATFPFGDASAFWDGRTIVQEFSPFMFYAAHYFKGTHLSELIFDWAAQAGVEQESILMEYLLSPVEGQGMSGQPLDYYPTDDGVMGQAFSRTNWDANASALHFQLVIPELGGHEHQDGLNFSWWRKGSFLTMEVPGRGYGSGWQVPDYSGSNPVDVNNTVAHNTLLFGEEGQPGTRTQMAKVLRMQSDSDFFYAAVDGTNSYKSYYEDNRYNNEYIDRVIREYLFIKPLETLIVFDRMKSNESYADFRKTFLMHLLGEPEELGEQAYESEYHGQKTYVKTLLPAETSSQVIYEGGYRAQYEDFFRLQVETEQAPEEYFLHVIHTRDSDDNNLDITFSEGENGLSISLSHAGKGFARVLLEKGMESKGGAFAYSTDALPSELAILHDTVQLRELTLMGGFKWLNLDGSGGTVLADKRPDNNTGLLIWPNPAEDRVMIKGMSDGNVKIYNQQGKLVKQAPVEGGFLRVSDLAAGIYILRLETEDGIHVGKLIKR